MGWSRCDALSTCPGGQTGAVLTGHQRLTVKEKESVREGGNDNGNNATMSKTMLMPAMMRIKLTMTTTRRTTGGEDGSGRRRPSSPPPRLPRTIHACRQSKDSLNRPAAQTRQFRRHPSCRLCQRRGHPVVYVACCLRHPHWCRRRHPRRATTAKRTDKATTRWG
jgi:hypothetical protein